MADWNSNSSEFTLKRKQRKSTRKKKNLFLCLVNITWFCIGICLDYLILVFGCVHLTLLLIHKVFKSFPHRWLQSRRKFILTRYKHTLNDSNEFNFAPISIHLPQLCFLNTFYLYSLCHTFSLTPSEWNGFCIVVFRRVNQATFCALATKKDSLPLE